MKRIVSALTLLLSITAASQNQVAIFAGPQASTANYSILNQKQDTKMKYGFNAGVAMKVPFDGFLYFAPEYLESMEGYDVSYNLYNSLLNISATDNTKALHIFEITAL